MDTDVVLPTKYNSLYYGPLISRALAKLIDWFILGLIVYPIIAWELNHYLVIGLMGVMFLYSVLCIWIFQTTIGKAIFRLKVLSTVGRRVTFVQALCRQICSFFSVGFIGMGELWVLINHQSRTWHDILCNTIVVVTNKEEQLEERFSKDPWEVRRFISYGKPVVVCITVLFLLHHSLDFWVNEVGEWGIIPLYSTQMEQPFRILGEHDVDKDGVEELIGLYPDGGGESIGIYKVGRSSIEEVEYYTIEDQRYDDEGIFQEIEWFDLDHDGVNELITSRVFIEDKEQTLQIDMYKKEGKELHHIQQFKEVQQSSYQPCSDVEFFEDSSGDVHMLWLQNAQQLRIYKLAGMKLNEEYHTLIFNSTLMKGNVTGEEEKSLYIFQQTNKDITISTLAYNNGNWNRTLLGTISDNLDHIYPLSREQLTLDDIDRDGQDEIILRDPMNGVQDRVALSRKTSGWCNIYTYDGAQWIKIWVGGNISLEKQKDFLMSVDIDQDQVNEWIMTDGKKEIYVYKQQPFLFRLNILWNQIRETKRRIHI